MSDSLVLTDSCIEGQLNGHKDITGYMSAIDELQKQFKDGTVNILCLHNYNLREQFDVPVWYEIQSYCDKYRRGIVNECKFFSSHYIGNFSKNGYSITINPRFGEKIFTYLISYATNLYIPLGESEFSLNNQNNSYWLIALMWKAMLNKALTTGQIPKGYKSITKNQKNYRGRLCISKHIHYNICDATKFCCVYKKLSMDNSINRTIRVAYKILKKKGLEAIIGEFEAYDKYLDSMGVLSVMDDIKQIDNINYTRLNETYRPVMELSKTILSNYKAETTKENGKKSEISYFIDVAELWEMYLLKLLQNKLSPEYHVYSPNSTYGTNLLEGKMRMIRPDILVERDGRVIMVIDAKYKYYTKFGQTSEKGVHRDDLYQMSTYLYHYGKYNEPILGIFTAPQGNDINNDVHSYTNNDKHKIGLVNLDINGINDISKIHAKEDEYMNTIRDYLDELSSSL